MKIAVITGASSGLGCEFFSSVMRTFRELDEIWLIARREDRLQELAAAYPDKKVVCLPLDLTREESLTEFAGKLREDAPEIRILINNAGFGRLGNLDGSDQEEQMRMVDLNCRALTGLSALCLPYMTRGAFILNVCSIAAFAPNPRMTVYCSTKAYVKSFSNSLREELKPKGVNVLAVCPGPMRTEFLPVAGIEKGNSVTFDVLPYCDPHTVAERALHRAAEGKAMYTPRAFFKFYRVFAKVLPHNFIMKFSKT